MYIVDIVYQRNSKEPELHFTKVFFHHNSNLMKTLFPCHSIQGNDIATNFCTCHNSTVVMLSKKFCSDQFNKIWVRVNFHCNLQWKIISDVGPCISCTLNIIIDNHTMRGTKVSSTIIPDWLMWVCSLPVEELKTRFIRNSQQLSEKQHISMSFFPNNPHLFWANVCIFDKAMACFFPSLKKTQIQQHEHWV